MLSTGLSKQTEAFLNQDFPPDWKVPTSYKFAISEMLAAQKDGQWGVSAKIGSQLAAQFRKAGFDNQALVFGELSVASTGIYAIESGSFAENVVEILDTTGSDAVPKLTFESKIAVAEFQAACGTSPDGTIGWQTMSCLPGGSGYKLPAAILKPLDSGSTGGGF